MQIPRFTVKRGEPPVRLVDFLARELATSKKKAKLLLDGRHVFVNDRRVWMARHVLRPGDRVEVMEAAQPASRDGRERLRILYRDENFVVVDKPAGLLSNGKESAETLLRAQTGCATLRVAHRLDRDISGCLLAALGNAAFERAVALFREHRLRKTYHAIVIGSMEKGEREVRKAIGGKRAVTRYRVLDAAREASHLLATIETGRTHQIRRHLYQEGHPVLGDKRYGTRGKLPEKVRQARRHMLHANSIAFTDPENGTSIRATAPLPADFRRALKSFGLR